MGWSPVTTVSATGTPPPLVGLTVGTSQDKAHGWERANGGYYYCSPVALARARSPCHTSAMPKNTKKMTLKAWIAKLEKKVEKRSSLKRVRTGRLYKVTVRRVSVIDSVRQKVLALFTELGGARTARLGEPDAVETRKTLASALAQDYPRNKAREIAFHLADWHSDAAFIVAIHLFPDRFTAEELCAGAGLLLAHVPNHLAAAAKLSDNQVSDVFEVGIFDDTDLGT